MTRPDHDGKQAGGERRCRNCERDVQQCFLCYARERSYERGFAAGIEAAAKCCRGGDSPRHIEQRIRALRPLPPPKESEPSK